MGEEHRINALIEEAREQAFRRELAEKARLAERERWLRAGKKALAGDLRALARQIAITENPPRIVGSGSDSLHARDQGKETAP